MHDTAADLNKTVHHTAIVILRYVVKTDVVPVSRGTGSGVSTSIGLAAWFAPNGCRKVTDISELLPPRSSEKKARETKSLSGSDWARWLAPAE